MFWPKGQNLKKLAGVEDKHHLHDSYNGYLDLAVRSLLYPAHVTSSTDAWSRRKSSDVFSICQTISNALIQNRGLDQEEPDFLNSNALSEPDDLDFNTLTNRFVDCICATFGITKKSSDLFKAVMLPNLPNDQNIILTEATIGSVQAVVSVRVSGPRNTAKWMINGNKVRRDEINPVLKRAICFEDQDSYNQFLADVQVLSLRARNLITRGLEITIISNNNMRVPVLLEFSRSGRTWSLMIRNPDGTEFKRHVIKGGATKFANILAAIERARRMGSIQERDMSVTQFLNTAKAIPTLGIESVRRLLATGLKTINEALARSRKLLEDTARIVKADHIEHTYGSKTMKGYKVTGSSGNAYLVACDKVTTHISDRHGTTKLGGVYSLPQLTYVCIVDKSNDQMGYDIVVNRLLALKNDSFIAGSVTTLSRYTD
jgi:hypothetical protein